MNQIIPWPKQGAVLCIGGLEVAEAEAMAHAKACLCAQEPRRVALFEANSHPDFQKISCDPGDEIKISAMRMLIDWASGKPKIAKTQVAVITPAHLMNVHAANAFLKILEEPSAETLFILVTDKPALLLPTIRSRCYKIRLQESIPDLSAMKIKLQTGFAALRSQQMDWVTLSEVWHRENLMELFNAWLSLLHEAAILQHPMGSGFRNLRWWKFVDALLHAKRLLCGATHPNTQLLLESLLLEYSKIF